MCTCVHTYVRDVCALIREHASTPAKRKQRMSSSAWRLCMQDICVHTTTTHSKQNARASGFMAVAGICGSGPDARRRVVTVVLSVTRQTYTQHEHTQIRTETRQTCTYTRHHSAYVGGGKPRRTLQVSVFLCVPCVYKQLTEAHRTLGGQFRVRFVATQMVTSLTCTQGTFFDDVRLRDCRPFGLAK